jgi:hypothetical protein
MIRVQNIRGLKGAARQSVCYVGRQCHGWPASPLANPFKVRESGSAREVARVVEEYRRWLLMQADREDLLRRLWNDCDRGAKPLGCWCVDSKFDGQHLVGDKIVPVTCHGQVLAEALYARFQRPEGSKRHVVDGSPMVWSRPDRKDEEVCVTFHDVTLAISPDRAASLAEKLVQEVARLRAAQAALTALTA